MFFRVILFAVLGIFNCMLAYVMIWGQSGLVSYRDLKRQHAEILAEKAAYEEKIVRLSHEIRLLKTDKSYQEKMIRQKLRYVRNNELVYIFD